MVSSIGTPVDITVSELVIESFSLLTSTPRRPLHAALSA
jgi:hypothetical protein